MALARWQATIVDDAGNVQDGASVEVRKEIGGAPLASIYSDRAGASSLGNPFVTGSDGFAYFHVEGGAYRITATKGAFSRTWRYVNIGTAGEYDVEDIPSLIQAVDAGYALAFESETAAPPGAGCIRFNNADLSAATVAYVSAENLAGSDIVNRLTELYSAARGVKDTFSISDPSTDETASFQIDGATAYGSPVDYVALTVSAHAGETAFTAGERVNFQPNRAGADGADGDVPSARTLTAGAGLTGGGDLSANRQFDVGAGTGISVAADTVGVDKASNANVWAAATNKVLTTDLIEGSAAAVALTDAATVAFDWDAGIYRTLEITTDRVLGNPTNGQPGTNRTVLLKSTSDSPTCALTFGNQYGGSPPTFADVTTTQWYLLNIFCVTTSHFIVTSTDGSAP